MRKCPYCDFVSFEAEPEAIDHEGYAEAVLAEIEARRPYLEGRPLATVFFGGGTPSLWAPASLGRVLARVVALAKPRDDLEVTVECNPTSLDAAHARALLDQGVNRLSIGVQSLASERLAFLGRLHDRQGALRAVTEAVGVMPRVSADLIYGVHGGSPEEAAEEVRRVASLGVGHLSAYALTIEPNTHFGKLARQRRLPLLEDDLVARSFETVGEALGELGLERYETSNFAKEGEQARHNLAYWRGQDYLGLGCSAYGTLSLAEGRAVRYRNPPNAERYLERARAGRFEPHEREELSPETRLRERLMLGLRLREGFDLEASATELGLEPWPAERAEAAQRLVAAGRLLVSEGRLSLPPEAWLYADGIAVELF